MHHQVLLQCCVLCDSLDEQVPPVDQLVSASITSSRCMRRRQGYATRSVRLSSLAWASLTSCRCTRCTLQRGTQRKALTQTTWPLRGTASCSSSALSMPETLSRGTVEGGSWRYAGNLLGVTILTFLVWEQYAATIVLHVLLEDDGAVFLALVLISAPLASWPGSSCMLWRRTSKGCPCAFLRVAARAPSLWLRRWVTWVA